MELQSVILAAICKVIDAAVIIVHGDVCRDMS